MVGEGGLCQIHRADNRLNIIVYFLGGIEKFHSVFSAAGYVVGIVDEKNQVILPCHIAVDNLVIEFFQKVVIFQPGIA